MFDDDVWRYLPLGPFPTLVVGFVGLGLLVAVTVRPTPRRRQIATALLALTALSIIALTLAGGDISVGRSVNLEPGAGIRAELDNVNQALGLVNILGNVAMFIPLGWLSVAVVLYTPTTTTWRGLGLGVLAGFGLTIAIETLQYILGRSADIDDILLNTTGATIGAAVAAVLSPRRRRTCARFVSPEPDQLDHRVTNFGGRRRVKRDASRHCSR